MGYANGPRIVTDGLALHLDAGNAKSYPGSGTSWYDLSGNGKHFTWSAEPTHNTGGVPSLETYGKTCVGPASNSFGITDAGGYTFFVAVIQNSILNSYSWRWSGGIYGGRGIFAHQTWSNEYTYFDQGGCCGWDTRIYGRFFDTTTKWSFGIFRRKGAERRLYQNLRTTAVTTTAAQNILLDSNGARVVDLTGWNAKLGLFLVYNRGLEDAEVEQTYRALKSRFLITE